MKTLYLRLLSIIAAVAGGAALVAANSACSLVLYEPEIPKELEYHKT